jgi:hypothetical protein
VTKQQLMEKKLALIARLCYLEARIKAARLAGDAALALDWENEFLWRSRELAANQILLDLETRRRQ